MGSKDEDVCGSEPSKGVPDVSPKRPWTGFHPAPAGMSQELSEQTLRAMYGPLLRRNIPTSGKPPGGQGRSRRPCLRYSSF